MGSAYKASLKNRYLLNPTRYTFTPNATALPYTQWVLDLDPHYTDKFGDPLERLTIDNDFNQGYQIQLFLLESGDLLEHPAEDGRHGHQGDDANWTRHRSRQRARRTPEGRVPDRLGPSTSALNKWQQAWGNPNVFAIGEITVSTGTTRRRAGRIRLVRGCTWPPRG